MFSPPVSAAGKLFLTSPAALRSGPIGAFPFLPCPKFGEGLQGLIDLPVRLYVLSEMSRNDRHSKIIAHMRDSQFQVPDAHIENNE